MTVHEVTARPSGRYWHVDVPGINRVTQAKSAREGEMMAKELIAIMTGEEAAQVHVSFVVPKTVTAHLKRMRAAKAAESQAREAAASELRTAAHILREEEHMTLSDLGAVLGVSHQRAHQLLEAN